MNSQLRSVRATQHRLLRHSLVLTFATAVLHGTNWLYHVVMSRALGPVSYGGLSALLGLLVIISVPVNTIQMGLSAFVARARANRQEPILTGVISRSLRIFGLLGAAAFVILSLSSSWLVRILRLDSPVPVVMSGSVLIWWAVLPIFRGWLQGTERYGVLGASLAAEGVLKLTVGVLLVALGFGLTGAVGGVTLAALGALVLTLWASRDLVSYGQDNGGMELRTFLRSLVPYGLAIGCFTMLTQADVVFVKVFLPPHTAGIYAAASTGAKIILYVTAALPMVMLPEIAWRHEVNEDGETILKRSLVYGGLPGIMLVCIYFLVPEKVVRLLYGSAYLEAAPLLPLLGVAMFAYELALLGIYAELGTRRWGVLKPLGGLVIAFPVLVWVMRATARGVAFLMVVLALLALGTVAWFLIGPARRKPTTPAGRSE